MKEIAILIIDSDAWFFEILKKIVGIKYLYKASFIYEQHPIGRCGPRRPKQQRPRGSQPSCDMDADQL